MARRYYGGWPPYVAVAERRKKAEVQLKKLREKGQQPSPVTIEGRTIARTFWGKAWCDNVEAYRDYEYRLPRGRSYVRNGLVIDLKVSALTVKAKVSGSSVYNVTVTVGALAPKTWQSICTDCAGGIDSLVELLQGRFSDHVMKRICRQDKGLFPKPSEIDFSCSCPDGANTCKHVAAVLYGVGARLDEKPELLFRLRAVDENDLVSGLDDALPLSEQPLDTGKILETEDISALFGLDIEDPGDTIAANDVTETVPAPARRPRAKHPGPNAGRRKPAGASRPAAANPRPKKADAPPHLTSNKKTANYKVNSSGKDETNKSAHSVEPAGSALSPRNTVVATKSRSTKNRKKKRKNKAKREFELTPDGFVKWWSDE